ncbi:MAG: hypothetical protein ABI779_08380 [Acidobacteriota bacterium]
MFRSEPPEPTVAQMTFHEPLSVEIRFTDGREIVFNGKMAAEVRETVQAAVRRGFARRMRGSSGPNSAAG